MRLVLPILLALLLLPVAHATWYYAGDTFTKDGIVYTVEGSDHEVVLLSVGTQRYLLRLGECATSGFNEYCYVDTAYPNDDDHVRYEAGEVLYGYDLTFETIKPAVTVSRSFSEDEPLLNEEVDVTVTIENTGDYHVTGLQYDEIIPAGLVATSGTSTTKIEHRKNGLAPGAEYSFSYSIKATAYGKNDLKPTFRYTSEGVIFNATVSAKSITARSPVTIDHHVTPEIDLISKCTYSVNITNDEEDDVAVAVTVLVPPGLETIKPVGLTAAGRTYTAAAEALAQDETLTLGFQCSASGPGSYSINLTVKTTSAGVTSTVSYLDTVKSTAEGIKPTIGISPSKSTPYAAGSQITVTGKLENENEENGFRKVQAVLSAAGLFETFRKDQGPLGASDKVTAFNQRITLPDVQNRTSYAITLAGTYESAAGDRFEFTTEKSIEVAPFVPIIQVTRTFSPNAIARGKNVTVTVSAKNVYGKYATIDTHEKLPPGVVLIGGLTYAEASIEKDATQQLYIYQLDIPPDFEADDLTFTTVARVRDDVGDPQEYVTAFNVTGEKRVVLSDGTVVDEPGSGSSDGGDAPDNGGTDGLPTAEVEDGASGDGFFARTWSWLKGLFS